MQLNTFLLIIAFLIIGLAGCEGHNSDHFPYLMKGLNVYVYEKTGEEHFAGYVEATYKNRNDGLSECQFRASHLADEKHLEDWSYICCTVTSSSSCATKVK